MRNGMLLSWKKQVVVLCAVLLGLSSAVFAGLKIGDSAPDFAIKDADGKTVFSMEQYRGEKIVYLDFFATWCTNCQEEMKALKEIHSRYKDQGLEMIAIDVQENDTKAKKFIAKYGIPFMVLQDPKAEIAAKYGLVGFPFNLIIDGDGKIVYMDTAPPKDFDKIFDGLKAGLKAKNTKPAVKAGGAKPVQKPAKK